MLGLLHKLRSDPILESMKPDPGSLLVGLMQEKREWRAGRMAFLARRKAIQAELEAGCSLAAINADHRGATDHRRRRLYRR